MDSPVFIIGTERSGSNLLRLILNSHSRIAAPHPPHLIRYFTPVEAHYGEPPLSDLALGRLVDDVIRFIRRHIYPWAFELDRAALVANAHPRDLMGVFLAVYEQCREFEEKARWACKSTFMIDYADRLLNAAPSAKLIWLIRDPRDVAASSRRSVFNPYHPYLTAKLWDRQQRAGLQLRDRLPESQLIQLRYEDLVSDAEAQVQRLCAFLDEQFEPEMLRYFETKEAQKSSRLCRSWVNTGKAISAEMRGRYANDLTLREIAWVELATRETMSRLNYPPSLEFEETVPPSVLALRFWDSWYCLGVEWESLFRDRNSWRRWVRDFTASSLALKAKAGAFV